MKILLEIEGENMAWSVADTCMVVSSMKSQPGACPFSWREGTSAGSQVHGEVAAGLRGTGVAVEVSGIGLILGSFLLDEGLTGDAVERIRLHFQSGIGDLLTAAGTDSVRTRMQGRERLLNPAKLFDSENIHG